MILRSGLNQSDVRVISIRKVARSDIGGVNDGFPSVVEVSVGYGNFRIAPHVLALTVDENFARSKLIAEAHLESII